MKELYRKLTSEEIALLEKQGCLSHSWDKVLVGDGFSPTFVHRVTFGGDIRLAANGSEQTHAGVGVRHAGIYNATLYDCTVGKGVYIANVGRFISGYDICEGAVIENVGQILCTGPSTFGNGVEVSTLNEGGGREVPIYDTLTAQIAYTIAMYRHRDRTIERLREMIALEVELKRARRGEIGAHCTVVNTTSIVDVRMGAHTTVDGATLLTNGTINSSVDSPSYVGVGVTARNFILALSSRVDTGSMLRNCYIGEGVLIENNYSAEHSLFFANSHCAHGEACAVFAGPFTVSHHRATLLIAGYFSFFNAGSGANQSNHMYKSGPVHQGVHRRGCKFGSDSYVLLPASTGIFTVVTGRHYSHHDSDLMPFSYLVEEAGDSLLLPALNLRSYGTARDIKKWPQRDRRVGVMHDLINYDLMSPYTGSKLLAGMAECESLLKRYPTAEQVTWNRVKIKTPALKKGVHLYKQALRGYLSELFETHGWRADASSDFVSASDHTWVDIAGMIAPKAAVEALLERIDRDELTTPQAVQEAYATLHAHYPTAIEAWARYALSALLHCPVKEITNAQIDELIAQGINDRQELEAAVTLDAGRDMAPLMAVGYGIDSPEERQGDFHAVRGIK